ncbi:hypothetical protein PPERSA_02802 [Pseudocohnilembus persalinus]|uniref:Uncharacterized protein n=1 Tax=Pseudocohnilembus persalinus TaxID=266149 RepID=A0A0V0QM73_PSEPJ|nr:hypothetical protein PPERSA_02802 [Pseudocohnilembus persalinus]|eukprot:KRX03423.1 hypothetical protein PPERSA_02802 [Pseudocohnilembus persalinus]
MDIKISNCVAVTEFKHAEEKDKKLDLQKIANKAQNASYNRNRFPAVVIRESEPKGTALIFDSGKIIIIGCQGKEKAKQVGNNIVKKIGKILYTGSTNKKNIQQVEIEVKNLVATYNMNETIDLSSFHTFLKEERQKPKEGYTFSKTENFPGLIFKFCKKRVKGFQQIEKSSLVALIFQSGKVVFTGGKDEEDIRDGVIILRKVIQEFKSFVENRNKLQGLQQL